MAAPLGYLQGANVLYELEDSETQIGRADSNDIVRRRCRFGWLPPQSLYVHVWSCVGCHLSHSASCQFRRLTFPTADFEELAVHLQRARPHRHPPPQGSQRYFG